MENTNNFLVTIKQKDPAARPDGSPYLWGLSFEPEFRPVDTDFHASTNFEMRGHIFKKVDVLELKGEGEDEVMQVVISKSLIEDYLHQHNTHTFILRANGSVSRLDDLVFIDSKDIPEPG